MSEEKQIKKSKEKLKELEKIADKKIDGETTSKILLWEDGDFQVKVHHGYTNDDGQQMREQVIYKDSAGQIIYETQHKADWVREDAEIVSDSEKCISCGKPANIIGIYGMKCEECHNRA